MVIKNSPKIVEKLSCAPFETVQLNLIHEGDIFLENIDVLLLCFECEYAVDQLYAIRNIILPEILNTIGKEKFNSLVQTGRVYLVGLKYDRIVCREISKKIRKLTRRVFKNSKVLKHRDSESPVFFVSSAADYGVKFLFDTVALDCVNSRKLEILKKTVVKKCGLKPKLHRLYNLIKVLIKVNK